MDRLTSTDHITTDHMTITDHLPGAATGEPPPQAVERGPVSPPSGDASAAAPGRFSFRPHPLTAALATLSLIAAVTVGTMGYKVHRNDQAEAASSAALAAAQVATPAILSYDYRHLDADFAAARAHLTGKFADQYARTTSSVVRSTAQRYRAAVRATVAGASVISAAPNRVVVLLFVNQTTTSTRVIGPKLDLNRVRMTLLKVDGDWRVSDVDAE
jgi:Mce-associated membrane protein